MKQTKIRKLRLIGKIIRELCFIFDDGITLYGYFYELKTGKRPDYY